MICPSCGSDNTDPHQYGNFDFEVYAPSIFQSLRIRFGLQSVEYTDEFLYKLCGIPSQFGRNSNKSVGKEPVNLSDRIRNFKPMTTNSKSGQLFYKSKDGLFILKSISKKEVEFLRKHLHEYYSYLMNGTSLICKVLGLYKVSIQYQKAVYVTIQKSVLYSYPTVLRMDKIYDLKGSTFGRQATRWRIEVDEDEMVKMNQSTMKQKKSADDTALSINADEKVDSLHVDFEKDVPSNNSLNSSGDPFESEMMDKFSSSFYSPEVDEIPKLKPYQSLGTRRSADLQDEDDCKSPPESSTSPDSMGVLYKRSKILKDLDFLQDKQSIKYIVSFKYIHLQNVQCNLWCFEKQRLLSVQNGELS